MRETQGCCSPTSEQSAKLIRLATNIEGGLDAVGAGIEHTQQGNGAAGGVVDEETESLLANALGTMSIQERERAYFDVHGVSETVDETPELIEKSLLELKHELWNIAQKDPMGRAGLKVSLSKVTEETAFRLAYQNDASYVTHPSFCLRFLRTEMFHIGKTARRMVLHFDLKQRLFGQAKLCKDITTNDLDSDDLKALKAGCMQILPRRDSSGRAILVSIPGIYDWKDAVSLVRYFLGRRWMKVVLPFAI